MDTGQKIHMPKIIVKEKQKLQNSIEISKLFNTGSKGKFKNPYASISFARLLLNFSLSQSQELLAESSLKIEFCIL